MFKKKVVLVTGGTGSFGHHIVRKLVSMGAKEIRIFSRDEKKQYDMQYLYKDHDNVIFMLGDVRDKIRTREAVKGVDIVYHAAALKHVPACEYHPIEAIKTNILGANNIIDCCLDENVEKVIAISTDKAVKPVNVMGMTKAIQEKLVIQANFSKMNSGTKLSCVRYGNVVGSRGSVVPFFQKLLDENKILSITHEEMTRFLLTLDDAVKLVLFTTENMKGGELFVKKAPSAKVVDVARLMAEINSKDFKYNVIGVRPGEKIHEVLISEEEMVRVKDKGDFFVVNPYTSGFMKGSHSEYSSRDNIANESLIKSLLKKYIDEPKVI